MNLRIGSRTWTTALALGVSILAAGAIPVAADTPIVIMGDTSFSPAAVNVPVGGGVTWVNHGNVVHTATSVGGAPLPFTTSGLGPGQTATIYFGTPGNYYYSSATDCLNGGYTPNFPCNVSYLVAVGNPTPVPTLPPAATLILPTPPSAPTPAPAPPAPASGPAPPVPAPAPAPPPPAAALPAGATDTDLPVGHFFTQTGGSAGPGYGYRVSDEGGIGMWSEYQRLGSVAALGYPISRRFVLDGFVSQATQKVIMQWRPDASPPRISFVNVFDRLHDLGQDAVLQNSFQIAPQLDPSLFDAGKSPDQARADRMTLLNADPAIAARYNAADPASVDFFGLPTSTVTNEGPFFVLRTQRTAIQHWMIDNPGAGVHRGDVGLVNGGDIARQLNLVPADAAIPESLAGQVAQAPAPPPPPQPAPQATTPPSAQAASPPPAAAPQAPAGPSASSYAWIWKSVNTAPTDCGDKQVMFGWLPDMHRIPCVDNAPNAGYQYISGHVLDKGGTGHEGYDVRMTAYGNNYDSSTDVDGAFTLVISNSCPQENRVYNVYIVDGQGRQSSNMYTVNYSNCNTAGEFHFDFIQNS